MINQIAITEDTPEIEGSILAVMPRAVNLSVVHGAIDINAEQNYAIQQLYKSEFAANIARKNPTSVQNAILNLAAIGISLNPATKHAYLVPRDDMICLDISYMGLMHLAQQVGSIEWGQAKIVYANDTYENQGLTKEPLHKFDAFGNRGEKVGVFCTVKLPSGDFLTEEMSKEKVMEIKESSKSKNSSYSPWNTFEEEMWRKSVVKRASKYWPKSNNNRFDTAVHTINQHEGIVNDDAEKSDAVKKLTHYTEDGTDIELFGFLQSHRRKNEDFYLWLYTQFPSGKKVSGKQKSKDGQDKVFEYIEIFKNGDESEINEAKEELTELEYKIIQIEIAD